MKCNTKPFIHLFETLNKKYFYDVNKNSIVEISDELYKILDQIVNKNGDMESCQKKNPALEELIKSGFLSPSYIKEMIHPADELLEYQLANDISMITLQVTQQCNLRCKYCTYSGKYKNRVHTNKRMDFETARKGIDYYIKHSKNTDTIMVTFYGGEPLLEFDLVKKCMKYIREEAEGKAVRFGMTTNGTLINKEIIECLRENNVALLISLDGPRDIHDKNRRFAFNDCGTYDVVMKNIEMIKETFPDYLKRISFSAVMDGTEGFRCTNEFFMNTDSFEGLATSRLTASLNTEKYIDKENLDEISEDYFIEYRYEIFKMFLSKIGRLNPNLVSAIVNNSYYSSLKLLGERLIPLQSKLEKCHHGGPCVPGVRRLFLNADGEFFPCERVSEASKLMKIGNIETGIEIDKVRKIMNIGKITEDECINCWNILNCRLCAAYADNTDTFSKETKLSNCIDEKINTDEMFKDYCTLLELGYKFEENNRFKLLDLKREGLNYKIV